MLGRQVVVIDGITSGLLAQQCSTEAPRQIHVVVQVCPFYDSDSVGATYCRDHSEQPVWCGTGGERA
jgi:hypothetical protein